MLRQTISSDTNRPLAPHNVRSTAIQPAVLASLTPQTGTSDTESLRSREGSITTDYSVSPIQSIIDTVLILILFRGRRLALWVKECSPT
jgi:hypothetical protein